MDRLELGGTGRTTTRLGFGGAGLIGGVGRRESLGLLETAFDAGIRHFDTAPMYGGGDSERCLARLLERHRAEVTITSKYGILRTAGSRSRRQAFAAVRTAAAPLARVAPRLKSRVSQFLQRGAEPPPMASFTAAEAAESLESSLRALGTDHLDLWLLHEAAADDLGDPGLLELLRASVASGRVGEFGVASERRKIPELARDRPEFCGVLQFEWSVTDPQGTVAGGFRLHHGAIGTALPHLRSLLSRDRALARRWSQETDSDLLNTEVLGALLLKAALEMNPESVILFFTRRRKRIEAAVEVVRDRALRAPALRLFELVNEGSGR